MQKQKSRQAVRQYRQALFVGFVAVLIIQFLASLGSLSNLDKSEMVDVLRWQSMENYPDFIAYGWMPLDIIVSLAMFYLLARAITPNRYTLNNPPAPLWRVLVGVLGVCTAFMGLVGTITYGWYTGIGYAAMAPIVVVFGFMTIGVMIGTARAVVWLAPRIWQGVRWLGLSLPAVTCAPLARWLQAKDIPEDKPEATQP